MVAERNIGRSIYPELELDPFWPVGQAADLGDAQWWEGPGQVPFLQSNQYNDIVNTAQTCVDNASLPPQPHLQVRDRKSVV